MNRHTRDNLPAWCHLVVFDRLGHDFAVDGQCARRARNTGMKFFITTIHKPQKAQMPALFDVGGLIFLSVIFRVRDLPSRA